MSALRTWKTIAPPPFPLHTPPRKTSALRQLKTVPISVYEPNLRRASTLRPAPLLKSTASRSMADSSSRSVDLDFAEIIVVRHGETEWNADGRIQGHLDVELNDVGRQQAASVADRLSREPKISAIYSSDLKRASETAETIAARYGELEVTKDPELRERHLGDLQGQILREAVNTTPEAYTAFISRRTDEDIPGGGESLDKLYHRCTSVLQRISRKHIGERVVVVTHGGVIRALHKRAAPNEKLSGKILNTSVNVFQVSDRNKWSIKCWNDVSHLSRSDYLESGFGGDKFSG